MLVPIELEQNLCLKLAVLTTAVFTKNNEMESKSRYDFEYACLKLCLYLLGLANNQNDSRGKFF